MKLTKLFSISYLIFSLLGVSAMAQDPAPPPKTVATKPVAQRGRKTQAILLNYENELVTGSTLKPDVNSISLRKSFNFKKIIRVRENFMNEMEDSVDSFKAN